MITQLRSVRIRDKSEYSYTVAFDKNDLNAFIVSQPPTYSNVLMPTAGYKYNGQIIQPLNVASVPPFRTLRIRADFGYTPGNIVSGSSYQFPKFVVFTSDGGLIEVASDESNFSNIPVSQFRVYGDVVNLSVPIYNDPTSNINVGYVTNGDINGVNDLTPADNQSHLILQFLTYNEDTYWNRTNNRAQYVSA